MDRDRKQNVFVLGLDEFQRGELETITNASNLAFHQLLAPEVVTRPGEHRFVDLLEQARTHLAEFDGTVDAIIAHWDFPTSVPEAVPDFVGFDPFDDDALATIELAFPFWIKPVKSHSSQLGFMIDSAEDFAAALPEIRDGIQAIGDSFNEALEMADLPESIAADSGNTCLAEQIVTGVQATVEGTMFGGEFAVHGMFDSPKDEVSGDFARYEYPAATLPKPVEDRMLDVCERYLRHIGYDNACWNIEFMWDQQADQLRLIEVNTRISQSHADLFAKVDGMSNHEVAVDIALGFRPRMPDRRGNFAVAAKCFLWTDEVDDGIVRRVPSEDDIAKVVERFPETKVEIAVKVGDQLSDLRNQSSYRYDLGTLVLGAQDREELVTNYQTCRQMLDFDIEPVEETPPR